MSRRKRRAASTEAHAMSVPEIAQALGMTPRAVEGVLARALAKLRAALVEGRS